MRLLFLFIFSLPLLASTLHLVTSSNPSRINPILATDAGSSDVAGYIFNGLVKYDKDAKEIIGDLAESYTFENNTTLIFKLRRNVKWHDGYPFTAKDVVFTYEAIHHPNVATPYVAAFREVERVEAVDDYTVKVTYKKPYFKALETWMSGILPYHLLKDEENLMSSPFNTAPVGTGPFKLKRLEFSKAVELEAFDDYFEHRPKIDEIRYHIIADPTTRFLMLRSNQLDIGELEAMQFERQVDEDFFKVFSSYEDISGYTYLGFNLRLEKFKDPRVRRALSLAIDRRELVDILYMGHGRVCTGPFRPATPSFNANVKAPVQDIEAAKVLLKAAGYDADHPLEFEIATSNANSIRPYAAQILQHQLSKIGVKVRLRIMEWQAFLNMVVFPRQFETVLLGWTLPLSADPYLLWHSDNDKPGGFNFIGYHNPEVDKMIDAMQYIVQRKELGAIQRKIFAEIVADDPYLFLFIPTDITVVKKTIGPIEPALIGIGHNMIDWIKEEPLP